MYLTPQEMLNHGQKKDRKALTVGIFHQKLTHNGLSPAKLREIDRAEWRRNLVCWE